jgi:hypothetical protein
MEVRLEASTGAACTPPSDQRSAPAISLPCGARWQETSTSWTLTVAAEPTQVARLVRLGGLAADPDRPYRFLPKTLPERGELIVTVAGSAEEWHLFETEAKRRTRRNAELYQNLEQMYLEWPLPHPSLASLKPGEFDLGDCIVRLLPDSCSLEIVAPIDAAVVEAMNASGFTLHPISDWKEQVVWDDTGMGILLKPEQADIDENGPTPPFLMLHGLENLMLHGLENSLGHPVLMRPFPATLEGVDEEQMVRLIRSTHEMGEELGRSVAVEGVEADLDSAEMEMTFQVEYAGIDPDDMPIILHLLYGLAEGQAEQAYGDEDPPEEWATSVVSALIASLLSGSRAMRAELAHRGWDASLERRLGERDTMALVYGVMYTADALRRAVGDARSGRVWSLPMPAALTAERVLQECAAAAALQKTRDVLADIFLCFDLGARYQLARVAPDVLTPAAAAAPDQDDVHQVG